MHFQNHLVPQDRACFSCHTDYTMYGGFSAKLRGLRHVYVQYLGTVPQTVKLYTPYNNRECLHCHAGARSFEEGATHTADAETFARIKSNQLSCTSSGCHELVHNVVGLKDAKFWKASELKTLHPWSGACASRGYWWPWVCWWNWGRCAGRIPQLFWHFAVSVAL